MENCLTSVELQCNIAPQFCWASKLVPVGIMIRTILVALFFIAICQANDCFDIIRYSCRTGNPENRSYRFDTSTDVENMRLTHYHCIMKCANLLSTATMDLALNNLHEKLNHECILIENLDFCVQYWKQNRNVDCEVPIKNMLKQNFQVSISNQPLQLKNV